MVSFEPSSLSRGARANFSGDALPAASRLSTEAIFRSRVSRTRDFALPSFQSSFSVALPASSRLPKSSFRSRSRWVTFTTSGWA